MLTLIIKRSSTLFFLLFLFTQVALGIRIEFPVTTSLGSMPVEPIVQRQRLHTEVLGRVVALREGDSTNRFACAFVFRISDNTNITIRLQRQHLGTIDANYIHAPTNKDLCVFSSGIPEGIDVMLSLSALQLGMIKALNHASDTENSAASLLVTSFVSTFNRWSEKPKTGSWRDRTDFQSAMRATDSEARAIHILQQPRVVDNIVGELRGQLGQKESSVMVESIEFHGSTTRDMCPFCHAHMNMIQTLANGIIQAKDNPPAHFLGYLKWKLISKSSSGGRPIAEEAVPITTFISSTVETKGNLNFLISPNPVPMVGRLYQFRIAINRTGSPFSYVPPSSASPLSSFQWPPVEKPYSDEGSHTLGKRSSRISLSDASVDPSDSKQRDPKTTVVVKKTCSNCGGLLKLVCPKCNDKKPKNIPATKKPDLQKPDWLKNYEIIDVDGDGNCGIWAVLQAKYPKESFIEIPPESNRVSEMKNIRRKASKKMPKGGVDSPAPSGQVQEPKGKHYEAAESVDVIREAKTRLSTPGVFIGPEHLLYVGEVLDLKIVVYDADQRVFLCAFKDVTFEPGKVIKEKEALSPEKDYTLLYCEGQHYQLIRPINKQPLPSVSTTKSSLSDDSSILAKAPSLSSSMQSSSNGSSKSSSPNMVEGLLPQAAPQERQKLDGVLGLLHGWEKYGNVEKRLSFGRIRSTGS